MGNKIASEQNMYAITIPNNVQQDQKFRVVINNREVIVTCPRGVKSGQRVIFKLPTTPDPNHQMFEVTVPDDVKAGQSLSCIANGQRVMLTCPPNVISGQKMRFKLTDSP